MLKKILSMVLFFALGTPSSKAICTQKRIAELKETVDMNRTVQSIDWVRNTPQNSETQKNEMTQTYRLLESSYGVQNTETLKNSILVCNNSVDENSATNNPESKKHCEPDAFLHRDHLSKAVYPGTENTDDKNIQRGLERKKKQEEKKREKKEIEKKAKREKKELEKIEKSKAREREKQKRVKEEGKKPETVAILKTILYDARYYKRHANYTRIDVLEQVKLIINDRLKPKNPNLAQQLIIGINKKIKDLKAHSPEKTQNSPRLNPQ